MFVFINQYLSLDNKKWNCCWQKFT